MDKHRITLLIHKLRSGTATREEANELEAFWYLAQTDETLFNRLSEAEKGLIKETMFERIRQKISILEGDTQPAVRLGGSRWLLGLAASVAMIVAISFFWTQNRQERHILRTAFGEQKTIQLPDESIVVINGNTTLEYAHSWDNSNAREVWIDGEAFFEVTHTTHDQKFIVHTNNGLDVQVLGTRFNVKSRRGKTEVMLEEGQVRLDVDKADINETMTLRPGELATMENSQLLKMKIEPFEYSSWKDQKLIFDQTTLREVGRILEDTYGMEVLFENEALAERKLSGEISSADVDDILNAVRETFDINVRQDGNRITFHL